MKITDYSEVSSLVASNVLPVDGSAGTKKVTAANAAFSLVDLADASSKFDAFAGRQLPLIDLTSKAAAVKADIDAGTFKTAVVGGYLEVNSHRYYLAHPNYWLHCGDTETTQNHMLVVPSAALAMGKMNDSDITTGAYVGSVMKGDSGALKAVADIIRTDMAALGFSILTHREYFSNAVADGYESAGSAYDSDIDLMNEAMVYGGFVFNNCLAPVSEVPNSITIDKSQIKLFAERPDLITTRDAFWWLRDVASAAYFAYVDSYGGCGYLAASSAGGVRPAFAIY